MAMKKVYSTKTGKVTWAQPNPARPGEYLMPADATEFPPPAFDDTSKKAKYVNNSWVTEDLTPEEIHEASGSTGTFIGQLDDIGNITLDSVTDGQALVWDATNNKWTNGNVATGEGGSIAPSGTIIQKKIVHDYGFYSTSSTTFQKYVSASFDKPLTEGSSVYIMAMGKSGRGAFDSNWGGRLTIFRDDVNLAAGSYPNTRARDSMCSNDEGNGNFIMQEIDSNASGTPTYWVALAEMHNGSTTNYLGYTGNNTDYGVGRTSIYLVEIDESGDTTVNITSGSNEIDGITSSDGRVGIGIENPHHNLHLAGDSSQYGSALKIEENTHATSARAGIHMGDWVIGQDAPGDGTKDFFFYNAGHRLFIKEDGRIGINTTTPQTKLDIAATSTLGNTFTGNIRGEGITISKSYVENDYISLLESSNDISGNPHVRIAARYNGSGSYLSFGTSASYVTGITNEALVINPEGRCYINNLLKVTTVSGWGQFGPENSGWFHCSTDRAKFYFNKQCQAVSGFATYSDERLKENVTVVENAIESLKKIRGVSFTWKKDIDSQERPEGKKFGVLAQEVLQIDPEMCEQPEAVTDGDDKFYTFDYSNLTPYFIEAIKEQQATIESQQAKIDSLEARLAALEAKLS